MSEFFKVIRNLFASNEERKDGVHPPEPIYSFMSQGGEWVELFRDVDLFGQNNVTGTAVGGSEIIARVGLKNGKGKTTFVLLGLSEGRKHPVTDIDEALRLLDSEFHYSPHV